MTPAQQCCREGLGQDWDSRWATWLAQLAASAWQQLPHSEHMCAANQLMFMDHGHDSLRSCYEEGVWERLQGVKAKYDPHGLMRSLDFVNEGWAPVANGV